MNREITFSKGIGTESIGQVERILQLQLGSLESKIARLWLAVINESNEQTPRYRCEIVAKLANTRELQIVMFNRGLLICVADATARLAREVKRAKSISKAYLGYTPVKQKAAAEPAPSV